MLSFKKKHLFLMLLVLLLTLETGMVPLTGAHGNISGKLVYTAEVSGVSTTDLMFSISVGSDPETHRFHITGGTDNSTAYPRTTKDGLVILCHAFPDTDQDGFIAQDKDSPVVGVLKTDGSDRTAITVRGEGAAYSASLSPDERYIVFAYANTDSDGDGRITIHDIAHLAIKELGQIDSLNPTPHQLASNSRIRILTTHNDFSVERPFYLRSDLIVFTGKSSSDGRTTVYLYNLSNDNVIPLVPAGAQTRNPAGSKDGTQIAVEVITLTEHYDAVYDIEAQTWTRLPSTGLTNSSLAWSVNGTLAMAISDGSNWQLMLLDGSGLRKLVEIPQKMSMVSFSPDGKAVAYLWDRDGSNHNVLAVATVDGGFNASVTAPDSNVKDYDWIPGS